MEHTNIWNQLRAVVENLVSLSDSEWEMLKSFFEERIVDVKTTLTQQGQIAREIYFIHSGLARLYYQTENNEQVTAFIFSENMFASCLESLSSKYLAIKVWKP